MTPAPRSDSLVCVAALLALAALLHGVRTTALDPDRSLAQFGHQVWLMEHGMPQHSVQALIQTRDGYLWLGTQEGLARFDGARFTVFDTGTVEGMKSDYVWSLFEDKSGALWAGTDGGGAVRFKDGAFSALTTAGGLSSDRVSSVLEDRAGRLWLGTNGHGVNLVEGGKVTVFTRKDGLPSDVVFALYEDRGGRLWAGTESGLARLEGRRFVSQPLGLESRGAQERLRVRAFCEDGSGNLWVGTFRGLFKLGDGRVESFTKADGLCSDEVAALFWESGPGVLWVGTYGGLNRLEAGRFESYTTRDGLGGEQVWSLTGDREGNLWVGTAGGLNRFRDTMFYCIGMAEGLRGDQVFAALETREGDIWIGTDGGGAGRLKGGHLEAFTTRQGLTSDKVRCFLEEPDGSILIGTDSGGIDRFNNGRLTRFMPGEKLLLNKDIASLRRNRDGTLWIGTRAGLAVLRGDRLEFYGLEQGLANLNVICTLEDRAGRVWVGTDGGGLQVFEKGHVRVVTTKDGLTSNYVTALYEDADGTLWIGTYFGGLSRFKDGKFCNYTVRTGLPENVVYSILEDDSGYFWMSGNRGVFRARKEDLEAVAAGRARLLACQAYDRSDGMETSECNGGTQSPAIRTRRGLLCFSTLKGLAVLDPRHIPSNPVPPPVRIEDAIIDGKPCPLTAKAALGPGRHRLEFRYTALSLTAPEKNRFRVRLEGFDPVWLDAGASREAVYAVHKPGEYVLRVVACNNDNVWNNQGAEFSFTVRPYFYESPVFFVLCCLTALLAGWGAYALRIRGLKARQAYLEALVDERTEQVRLANQQLESANRELELLSNLDGLTGVANRRSFEERLQAEWQRAFRAQEPLSLFMLDLDHFKGYNDTYGHQAGDACLKGVTEVLMACASRAGDLVARYGGEEFVGILPATSAEGALTIAERIRQRVGDLEIPNSASEAEGRVTVSIGLATAMPTDWTSPKDLLAEADKALYLAKERGRNRVVAAGP